jgi:putative RNA 2'-phosphotransferase
MSKGSKQGSNEQVRVSKFLSLVLRHEPGKIGITLDETGWVGVDELLNGCRAHGFAITREELHAVVASSDKQRFAFSEDRTRIRANQGHSVDVELGYEPAEPPEVLYHGTPEKFVDAIRREGLKKMQRHHVHMSESPETTLAAGARRGKPVLLTIKAREMAAVGHVFFVTPNRVWLTDAVPPQYLVFP